jgi:hypothetical protein
MITLAYVDVRTGRTLDTVSWQGEGSIRYATGAARPVLEGLLIRRRIPRAALLGGWSNGYVQLRGA